MLEGTEPAAHEGRQKVLGPFLGPSTQCGVLSRVEPGSQVQPPWIWACSPAEPHPQPEAVLDTIPRWTSSRVDGGSEGPAQPSAWASSPSREAGPPWRTRAWESDRRGSPASLGSGVIGLCPDGLTCARETAGEIQAGTERGRASARVLRASRLSP